MKVVTAKRNPSSGDLYYYCLSTGEGPVINPEPGLSLSNGRFQAPCCDTCEMEPLPSRFRVWNASVEPSLIEFEPPKAKDEMGGLKGHDLIKSNRHSWAEPKLDGARIITHVQKTGVTMTTRRRDKSGVFNEKQDNMPHLRDHPFFEWVAENFEYTIFDGEVIAEAGNGKGALQNTMSIIGAHPDTAIATQQRTKPITYWLFDLPHFDGTDISQLSLRGRHQRLETLLADYYTQTNIPLEYIEIVPHIETTSAEQRQALYVEALDRDLEGLVTKDPNAGYFQSGAWAKIKQKFSIDGIVFGFEPGIPGGKYSHTLGGLKVAVRAADNGKLREICLVTPGDDATRDQMYHRLNGRDVRDIVNERIIVELEGQLVTGTDAKGKGGRLRHPRVLKYRPDLSEPNVLDFETGSIVRA